MLAEAEALISKDNIDDLRKARDLCEKVLTQDPYSEKGIKTLDKVYSKFKENHEKILKTEKEEDLRKQLLYNDLTPWDLKRKLGTY